MKESALGAGEALSLSEMMGAGADETQLWEPEELAAILKHQLAAPIVFDLSYTAEGPPPRLDAISPSEGPSIETFGELFHHPRPPVELLERVKQFAKSCRNRWNVSLRPLARRGPSPRPWPARRAAPRQHHRRSTSWRLSP